MVVLETSFLIDFLRNQHDAVLFMQQLQSQDSWIYVTSPTVMELWSGVLQSHLVEKEKIKINNLLSKLAVLDFDNSSAKQTAEIMHDLKNQGAPINLADAMIGAIVFMHSEVLVTRDEHFARIPGLRVLKY